MNDGANKPLIRGSQPLEAPELFADIRRMIEETRSAVATTVNAGLTMLYWRIGHRIQQEILKGKRADYGAEIVSTLSRQLEMEYGSGFSAKSIRHMIRFAEAFPDEQTVSALRRQLSWTHFERLSTSTTRCEESSTPKCAALSGGALARFRRGSPPCSTSARRFPG